MNAISPEIANSSEITLPIRYNAYSGVNLLKYKKEFYECQMKCFNILTFKSTISYI